MILGCLTVSPTLLSGLCQAGLRGLPHSQHTLKLFETSSHLTPISFYVFPRAEDIPGSCMRLCWVFFSFFGVFGDALVLLLAWHSRITPDNAQGDHVGCQGSTPGWLHARQILSPLFYHCGLDPIVYFLNYF